MQLNPAQLLGPYEILALLSTGGMGEVYKARDTRLGRFVAVKVLTGLGREPADALLRFRREARAAGALNHPNVLLVHDVGEIDGQPYLVSEFIEGGTLRDLFRAGPLSAASTAQYGAQIARGLHAAHQQGVVHRDLKPENVMLTHDGRVKIVDFGVATVETAIVEGWDGASTGALRTMPGTLLGTVAYMSPEQLRGAPLDHRTDIFSLGVVLYEAIEGTVPFAGSTAAELIASVLRDDPPPMRFAPAALARIIERCLEKSPAARYQSAADLGTELEGVARPAADGSAGLAVLAPRTGQQPVRTVAVLPFSNMPADPENEYFSDGLAEELIHALSHVRGLQVLAWNSASKLKGQTDDAQAAGAQLGAEMLLTGSVRRAGDRVRIAARLVETVSGYLMWSSTYDRRVEDLFAIQEEIARAIVDTLTERLQLSGTAGSRHQPASHEAYNLYLKGRYFWHQRTRASLLKAIECFDGALAIDATSALAQAGLADAYCLLVEYGMMAPAAGMPRAREAALRALTVDPRSAEAHASFGLIRALYDWEWLESEAFFRRALELNPGYATAHHWFSIDILAALGRFDEAHEEIEAARRLDPLSLIIAEGHAYLYTLARRFDEAVAGFRGLLDLDPSYYKAYSSLGRAYAQQGRYDDAAAMLEKAREMAGDLPSIVAALGQVHGMAGRSDAARALLGRLQELDQGDSYVPATSYALVHAGLGERGRAMDWLDRAVERRDLSLSLLKVHPAYDAVRDDPRFEGILRRLRL